MDTYLLLFHQLPVRTIVNDVGAKHWRGKGTINLLRIDIFQLAIENELIPFGAQIYCRLSSKQDESEDITVLSAR